jgi:hypothetical protein
LRAVVGRAAVVRAVGVRVVAGFVAGLAAGGVARRVDGVFSSRSCLADVCAFAGAGAGADVRAAGVRCRWWLRERATSCMSVMIPASSASD